MKNKFLKGILRILFLLGLAISIAVLASVLVYHEGVSAILTEYEQSFKIHQKASAMAAYGNSLSEIDEVRLLVLVETNETGSYEEFKAPYTSQKLFIKSSAVLANEEAQQIASLWRKLSFGDGGAACFEPHHVLQFRKHQRLVCESVVCFLCGNLTLPSFPSPVLVGFHTGDDEGTLVALKSMIEKAGR